VRTSNWQRGRHDIGTEEYDVIVASSVFEHVEKWYDGLKRCIGRSARRVLFFESTNKFSLKQAEYPVPFLWLAAGQVALSASNHAQGPEIMKLGIDFNQFRYAQLRRVLGEIGFKTILDVVDLSDLARLRGSRKR